MSMPRILSILVVALTALWLTGPAGAQGWPQKPVKIVVPFAPGGNTDGIARIVAQHLTEALGQQFFVENRAGAGGAIAADMVARAPADGHTLFVAALPQIAIIPAMTKTSYDPVKDLAPISNIATNPFVLAVNQKMPVKSLAEFVAYVRQRPGQLSYASAGAGSVTHLSMALFLKVAGLEMVHVIYKGNAPALSDVVAGHVPAMFTNLSDALPQATAGTIRLLAISSEQRAAQVTDIPTVSESGFPKFRTLTWNGMMAPAGTPDDIITRVAAEIARAVKDPKIRERFASYGVDPLGDSPQQFAATIAADIALWAEAIRVAGVKGP